MTVGGRVARLGDKASLSDAIAIDGRSVALPPTSRALARVIVYNKPEGELVTRHDPQGRATVFDRLPALHGTRWVAVGRLDLNTSGLLLLTDSGELANRLAHPRSGVLREYAVRVHGVLAPEARQRLMAGVRLSDGTARFERIEPMGEVTRGGRNRWYRTTLREGRNREVRRLFEALGLQVSRLIRLRFGPLELPRDLPAGRWREVRSVEVGALLEAARQGASRGVV